MAELHTLNVTRGFIRKAVSELSGHHIISTDGQKVRWKSCCDSVSRKRKHDDDLSGNVIDETSGPKGKQLKATHAIGSQTSLRMDLRLKHAPSSWISRHSDGKLVCAPRLHFSTKDMTDSISSFNPRNRDRGPTKPSDLAENSGAESIAHGYALPQDHWLSNEAICLHKDWIEETGVGGAHAANKFVIGA
jgi:hypothetical protein